MITSSFKLKVHQNKKTTQRQLQRHYQYTLFVERLIIVISTRMHFFYRFSLSLSSYLRQSQVYQGSALSPPQIKPLIFLTTLFLPFCLSPLALSLSLAFLPKFLVFSFLHSYIVLRACQSPAQIQYGILQSKNYLPLSSTNSRRIVDCMSL